MKYIKHLSEPWFSLIKLGIKKCEGRLKKGDFSNFEKGDIIVFENNDFGFNRTICVKITSIHHYPTFEKYLESEKLETCLPGIDSIEDGLKVYYKYYSKIDENKYHIIAIRFRECK
jgi:ASC-1-like (ASCH) protein